MIVIWDSPLTAKEKVIVKSFWSISGLGSHDQEQNQLQAPEYDSDYCINHYTEELVKVMKNLTSLLSIVHIMPLMIMFLMQIHCRF